MSCVLLHVGYHKTATTWLQRNFFNNARVGFVTVSDHQELLQRVVQPNGLDFDAMACRAHYDGLLARAAAPDKARVLSSERLCGNLFFGARDSKDIADRLHAIVPNARIFMAFREQRGMIASTYQQYVSSGGPLTLPRFLKREANDGGLVAGFDMAHFRYDRLIGYYQTLFGKDNVLAMPYELFCQSPLDYLRCIANFAGLQPTDADLQSLPYGERTGRLNGVAVALKRRLNRVVRGRLNPAARLSLSRSQQHALSRFVHAIGGVLPPANRVLETRVRRHVADVVGDYYRESNQRTMAWTGWDLTKWGYDVATPAQTKAA